MLARPHAAGQASRQQLRGTGRGFKRVVMRTKLIAHQTVRQRAHRLGHGGVQVEGAEDRQAGGAGQGTLLTTISVISSSELQTRESNLRRKKRRT